jgi:hypothetical protein
MGAFPFQGIAGSLLLELFRPPPGTDCFAGPRLRSSCCFVGFNSCCFSGFDDGTVYGDATGFRMYTPLLPDTGDAAGRAAGSGTLSSPESITNHHDHCIMNLEPVAFF